MAVANKLPRRFYKRASPQRVPVPAQKLPKESTVWMFGGKATRSSYARVIGKLWGEDLTQTLRYTHMSTTMDQWAEYKKQGRLTPEVAIIVDGSTQRPISNVKVFGEIVIQEPPNLETMFNAVEWVYSTWFTRAQPFYKSGDYVNNLHIFANNSVWIDPQNFLGDKSKLYEVFSQTQDAPFFTIINTMPYAAKEERNKLPGGLAYYTWKGARSAFGADLALRFRYYTSDQVDIGSFQNTGHAGKRTTVTSGKTQGSRTNSRDRERYAAGKPLSFPAINIGTPGAFNSGASKVLLKARRQVMRP